MNELDRSAIKRDARAFIGQDNRWWFMFVAYLPILAIGIVSSIGLSIYEFFSLNYFAAQISDAGSTLIDFILIPFTVAFYGFFLNHLRGFSPDWKSVYKEGFDRYWDYLLVGFVTGLIIGVWTLLFIIPGIIAALSYSQVYYVLHDNPQVGCKRAREISSALTDGCKWDLFVLELSFIGWWLLVGLTAGIAFIYVWPYYQTTKAMYYENLKQITLAAGTIQPEDVGLIPFDPYAEQNPTAEQNPCEQQNPYAQQNPYGQQNPYRQQYPYGQQSPNTPQYPYGNASQPPYTQPPADGQPQAPFTPPQPEDTFRPGEGSEPQNPDNDENTFNPEA